MAKEIEVNTTSRIMSKIKIGHKFECPEGHNFIMNIGGYAISEKDYKIFITGNSTFDLSESPIQESRIVPLHTKIYEEDLLDEAEKTIGSVANVFDFSGVCLYYMVLYGDRSYVFLDTSKAFKFMNFLLGYKADGLLEKYGDCDE